MTIIKCYMTQNPCYKNNVSKVDSRYTTFQSRGPRGLMLHSVGCAQPDASVFISGWNKPTYTNSCVHGIIDANSGDVFQTLPWNYRGWHGGGSCNNTHVGIEMCESGYIKYPDKGGIDFTVLNRAKAVEDCTRTYHAAVELFAMLCKQYNLDPMTDICSHREGGVKGIATKHADPEHYWTRLGMPYTMDTFRAAVKAEMSKPRFSDVPKGRWYTTAVEWCAENGIVNGVGGGKFKPQREVTRAELCQVIYNLEHREGD